ncbi:UDP-glucuronate:xylan alpha-glucuronosyltransferase 2-like [Iris pallida]|uniref:Hexosyltransferase n=1 Tax=Iris pallida TaxID=29817 RepID=A0AAX6ESI5_IRIPA|nr:UDP-glucuronate:xylan alpha-glucuronosyltransferase 2-like [Iris pallida]
MGFGEMVKSAASKSLVIKINLTFLAVFLIVYLALLLQPPPLYEKINGNSAVHCSLRECIMKKVEDRMMKKMAGGEKRKGKAIPAIFNKSVHGDHPMRIGIVNMGPEEEFDWGSIGEAVAVEFEHVSGNLEWKDLFPEWIDEEEENEGTSCPEIPMPDLSSAEELDVVVARIPCRQPESGWNRDVFRLQAHLVAARLAARRGRRDGSGKVRVAVKSECRPMMEIFRCDDVVGREGEWWMFEVDGERLEEKMELPVGSCMLSMPLWQKGNNEAYDLSKFGDRQVASAKKEAYATVLHSSDLYVCGAIVLAQSILKSGSTRDLILLHDASIPQPKLLALSAAGWKLRMITRIRNPRAEKNSYNEYNYSKLRLWQLTDYHKLIFIDADIIVLRNLDILFSFPQITAVGNDGVIFNSGIMVIEPSNCTFKTLMKRRYDVISYNGGDQGFLNEVFVWWHRLPRRVNFLKNFWSNDTAEAVVKNSLFGADPPQLYAIHYLGLKPWVCHKQYDCNWNIGEKKVYASDIAHQRWWKVHDDMDEGLKGFCGLSKERKESLESERKGAEELDIGDGHWRIKID